MTRNGETVNVSSPNAMDIQRQDNTEYAWQSAGGYWTIPSDVAGYTLYTFAGHFGAPSTPTSTPRFGDNLLGVFQNLTTNVDSEMLLTFAPDSQIQGVSFRVSSALNSDFTALLQAYDSSNNLLGSYQVDATGVGGACAGLGNPDTGGNPLPCNDAPTIQFYDPAGQIASVKLMVNDPAGAVIDQLALLDPVPEPATSVLTGLAVIAGLVIARKRGVRSV